MNAQAFAETLRSAADWWDAHPELPAPDESVMNVWVTTREEFAIIARSVGHAKKNTTGSIYWLRATMGDTPLSVDFNITRSEVCDRRVVGTREVPETVTPAHTEEIVEWDCRSIFADGTEAAAREIEPPPPRPLPRSALANFALNLPPEEQAQKKVEGAA